MSTHSRFVPKGWSFGASELSDLGVMHGLPDLVADELGGERVRILVEQKIHVAAEKRDAARLPSALELSSALLRRDLEGGFGR